MNPFVQAMDLSYIVKMMCSAHYPLPRWTLEKAQQCEHLYRRFFALLVDHPTEGLVPSKAIDEFWHNHILHTKRYMHDCMQSAGRYLHHQPSDPDDSQAVADLSQGFLRTCRLYQESYGKPLLVLSD
jgi:hypothetical protein